MNTLWQRKLNNLSTQTVQMSLHTLLPAIQYFQAAATENEPENSSSLTNLIV